MTSTLAPAAPEQRPSAAGKYTAARRRKPLKTRAYKWFRVVALVLIVVTFVAPLAWMLLSALKTNVDIYDVSKTFAFTPTLDNFTNVLGVGVPAAYVMSRFSMQRSAGVVLLARIIPGVSLLVPWYFIFANLRMVGDFSVLILSHMFVALPLIVYIMMSFFDSLPEDLEESAQVDGLTPIGAFWHITLPLSTPGIATAGILSIIFSWNNFMFALVLSGANTKTLPVAIFNFVSYASIDWGGLMAAAVVVTLPIMVIALFTQKYIVSGLTAGATKG
jgi:multiple sugar transport system permease protein